MKCNKLLFFKTPVPIKVQANFSNRSKPPARKGLLNMCQGIFEIRFYRTGVQTLHGKTNVRKTLFKFQHGRFSLTVNGRKIKAAYTGRHRSLHNIFNVSGERLVIQMAMCINQFHKNISLDPTRKSALLK